MENCIDMKDTDRRERANSDVVTERENSATLLFVVAMLGSCAVVATMWGYYLTLSPGTVELIAIACFLYLMMWLAGLWVVKKAPDIRWVIIILSLLNIAVHYGGIVETIASRCETPLIMPIFTEIFTGGYFVVLGCSPRARS